MEIGQYIKENYVNDASTNAPPRKNDGFEANDFFDQKTAYYPGSANDGFLIEALNRFEVISNFIYVDYGFPQKAAKESLINGFAENRSGFRFRGYKLEKLQELAMSDLLNKPFSPSISVRENSGTRFASTSGFALWLRFVRDHDIDIQGAERFELLYIGGDGIATYDALFSPQNGGYPAPRVMLIEDYGFGGNCDRFDRGGGLEQIAKMHGTEPDFLIFGQSSQPWESYYEVVKVEPSLGGMHRYPRKLYEKTKA